MVNIHREDTGYPENLIEGIGGGREIEWILHSIFQDDGKTIEYGIMNHVTMSLKAMDLPPVPPVHLFRFLHTMHSGYGCPLSYHLKSVQNWVFLAKRIEVRSLSTR